MGKITVWTKQHVNVFNILQKTGRYTAKKEYIQQSEEAMLIKDTYDWLVRAHPDLKRKPADADYPVWVSFQKDATMLLSPDSVIFELELDQDLITYLNVIKWTMINNYEYIPLDAADAKRHKTLLHNYGISDPQACMSQFYPEIKREIENSWTRAFDDTIQVGNDHAYGLIWEIKKEWVRSVLR